MIVSNLKGEKMKQNNPYRFAERCLYDYKKNLARIDILNDDLHVLRASSDVHEQSYNPIFSSVGSHSDPVFNYVAKIDRLEEEIRKLKRLTDPITRLMNDLQAPEVLENSKQTIMLQILCLIYFGNNNWQDVAIEIKIGKSLLFQRRGELVKMAIDYLGF